MAVQFSAKVEINTASDRYRRNHTQNQPQSSTCTADYAVGNIGRIQALFSWIQTTNKMLFKVRGNDTTNPKIVLRE